MDADDVVEWFRNPAGFWTRQSLMAKPCPIPAAPGLYGWYFDELPDPGMPGIGTRVGAWSLLYIGIAPGRPGSASNLRRRLRNHLSGNARGSTLRLSLGALLAERLGLVPEPASGKLSFGASESILSEWLDAHARVAWLAHPEPWTVEPAVVRALGVPLNRGHNEIHPFHAAMGEARFAMRQRASTRPRS